MKKKKKVNQKQIQLIWRKYLMKDQMLWYQFLHRNQNLKILNHLKKKNRENQSKGTPNWHLIWQF